MSRGDTVAAWVHSHDVAYSWHSSMMGAVTWDMSHDSRLSQRIAVKCGAGGLVEARNEVAASFLGTGAEWLWITDTDMGFAPDTLDRLLAAADPVAAPVVGALCFAWLETDPDGLGGYRCGTRPTIFQFAEVDDQKVFAAAATYPPDELLQVAATGSACLVIHRTALERVHEAYGATWYERIPAAGGKLLGEDISFCARVGSLQMPVFVHTGIHTNHQKRAWISHHDHDPAPAQVADVPGAAQRNVSRSVQVAGMEVELP